MSPHFNDIEYFPSKTWAESCALIFQREIEWRLALSKKVTVMLTGGESVRNIYKAWSKFPEFKTLRNVTFFLSDERIGLQDNYESNYHLVMSELFFCGLPMNCDFESISRSGNSEAEAERYGALLPDSIDVLVLSMGLDGHIASLFPDSKEVYERTRKVVTTISPQHPKFRISISPLVIERARMVYVLVSGKTKVELFNQLRSIKKNYSLVPAQMVERGIWLLNL